MDRPLVTRPVRWILAFATGAVLLPLPAAAQLSPGRLSRVHERLEGSDRCLDCHDRSQGVSAVKCFACHKPLQERVAAGKGLHARAEYRDCKKCHIEHQGIEYDLVWWGQGRPGGLRPRPDRPPFARQARPDPLREMPRDPQLPGGADDLRRVPRR